MGEKVDKLIVFTGTRHGMSTEQRNTVYTLLTTIYRDINNAAHGCCMGADYEFDNLFYALRPNPKIGLYPSTDIETRRMPKKYDTDGGYVHSPMDPLVRNRLMVDLKPDVIIATPFEMVEKLRSGTWACIRYARKKGIPITIVRRDGIIG